MFSGHASRSFRPRRHSEPCGAAGEEVGATIDLRPGVLRGPHQGQQFIVPRKALSNPSTKGLSFQEHRIAGGSGIRSVSIGCDRSFLIFFDLFC